jgi:hypothetical protein
MIIPFFKGNIKLFILFFKGNKLIIIPFFKGNGNCTMIKEAIFAAGANL